MNCPYNVLPASSWWDKTMAGMAADTVDPHLPGTLRITDQTRVASAGSCFAQRISQALIDRNYNYLVTEAAPAALSTDRARQYNYGVYTARYGNVYTPTQLLQLVQRAVGRFEPRDQYWSDDKGRCFDLLRPRIVPQGFASRAEAMADTRQHLAAVRRMVESAEVFVFTLGLTESWRSTLDGTVYPTCPGCGNAGDFDPSKYEFHNASVIETCRDLSAAIALIRSLNPEIQIVLTVSPVPLVATMEQRHVLQATTYSKSVLRVAAEEMVRQHSFVHYFASYEIITATRNTREFVEDDGRTISARGVGRAMDLFFAQFTDAAVTARNRSTPRTANSESLSPDPEVPREAIRERQVVCDEEDFFRALAQTR